MADGRSGSPIIETLAIFAIVFALQLVAEFVGSALMAGLFVLAVPVLENPWTIVTSVYAHGSVSHLLANSVALVLFGWPVARATTRWRFHAFFVTAGAIAGLSQVLVTSSLAALPLVSGTTSPGVLGASGAVFALLGYLLAGNRLSVGLASLIDAPRWLAWTFYLALALVVTYLAGTDTQIAVIAHFTGFLLGLLAGRANVLRTDAG